MKKYVIGVLLFLAACTFSLGMFTAYPKGTTDVENTLQITTSFYPLYFFASEIAGDKAIVRNITPAGAEPHEYDPSVRDIADIEKSSLLVLNGGVEAWGDKVRGNLKELNVPIIEASEGLLKQRDPHVWLDPLLAKKEAHAIETALEKIDPSNALFYRQNLNVLDEKLDRLHDLFTKGLSSCETKDIVTSHSAFGYLASRYGLRQVSVTGLSPDEEPSVQQIAKVAEFAKKNNIRYIFFETLVNPKLSETVAQEIGAQTIVLDPIEGVSDDDRQAGKNYLTIMEDNLKNLQRALSCKL